MVNFCGNCGSFLIPNLKRRDKKEGYIALDCNLCKKSTQMEFKEISYQIKIKIPHSEKDRLQAIEEEFYTDPSTRNTCPRCGYHEAHYWEGMDRRKQEWESIIYYKCTKCKWTWYE